MVHTYQKEKHLTFKVSTPSRIMRTYETYKTENLLLLYAEYF